MSGPVHLPQPTMQDLCYEAREVIKDFHRTMLFARDQIDAMHNALNRERSYRQDDRPFDATEIPDVLEKAAKALWGKAREMRAAMEGAKQ